MITLFAFIFVLGVLVFIHEFGHFIVAKLVGIRVERFSLGFPPRMIGKKIGETDYCISWIPIGGYVKLSGMIDESLDKDSIKGEPYEFMSKPAYQRFIVIFAGPLMNILLALSIFSMITFFTGISEPYGPTIGVVEPNSYSASSGFEKGDRITSINGADVQTWEDILNRCTGESNVLVGWQRENDSYTATLTATFYDSLDKTLPAIVGDVINDFPAAKIGMIKGDRIIRINDQPIKTWDDLTEIIHSMPDQEIMIEWQREGERFSGTTIPVKEKTDGSGRIGISFLTIKQDVGFFQSFQIGAIYSINLIKLVQKSMKQVFSGKESFKDAFGGPIVIAKMAGESAKSGAESLFIFMAFLSLNLGILNLLPIPVLDGGHLVFILIEGIIRKPLSSKTKIVVQQVGMALLLAFMVFVIINDIRRIW